MVKYTKKIGDMEKLPDDILSKIFIRLLAKQLAQMRCVSKSWNALLSEPNFVKSHLHRSIHNNDEILLFFKELATYDSNRCPATIRASRSPAIELTNLMKLIKLPFDPQHKKAFGTVIGSVNGLICFCYEHLNQPDIVIRIWNPSLSALLTLPPFSLSYNEFHLGFGFDPKTDDYKVVKVGDIIPKEEPNNMMVSQPQGEVYSMRKGYWEPISERIPSHIKRFISQIGVYVDGHLYWLCATDFFRKPHTERIVAFDLSAMTYSEVPLPDPELPIIGRCDVLGVLGGKLCVMTTNAVCGCECDVWVMDDGSWVKHHAFSEFKCHITPYGFTSSKEFLFQFQDGCRFAFYDPVATNTKPFKIKWTQKYERYIIVEYVDSLVWIEPDNQFKSVA